MFKLKLKNRGGFTVTEVLVTAVILTSILGMMYGIQVAVNNLFQISKEKVNLQAQARITLNYMNLDLKNATRTSTQSPSPNLSIPSAPNNNNMTFYLPADKDGDGLITDANGEIEWATNVPISYQYVPVQEVIKRVIPYYGIDRIFAQNVTDVQFIDANIDPALDINELRIILTLDKTTTQNRAISYTLTSIVRLRN